MKIVRVLDEGMHIPTTKTNTRLIKYAELANTPALKVRPMVEANANVLINGKPIHAVSLDIKKGYLHSLKDVYEIKDVPKNLELKTKQDIQNLPAYHYGAHERYSTSLSDNIKQKSPPGALDHLDRVDVDLTMKDLEKSPALKSVCTSLEGKKVITLTGKYVIIGVGLVAVVSVINQHRKDLQSCTAFRYINGNLTGCKIATCTCIDGEMNTSQVKYNICGEDVLKLLPDEMKDINNCKGNKGLKCIQCPSQSFRDMYGKNEADLDKDTELDKVYIECRIPSVFAAIGDLTNSIRDETLDIVKSASKAVGWFFKNLPTILIGGACIFALVIIVWFMKSLGIFNHNNNHPVQRQYKRIDSDYVDD